MTFENSPPTLFDAMELPSMSSAAASPARISVPRPLPLRELKARGLASGESMPVSFAKFDLSSSSWKMYQPSSAMEFPEFSVTWPTSGTIVGGIAYRLQPLVPLIRGIGSGLWPTPRKCSGKNSAGINRADFYRSMGFSRSSTTKGGKTASPSGGPLNPAWIEGYMGFPIGWTDLER